MRLRLNLNGVDVQLKINDWHKPNKNADWDDWCYVELVLISNYLNYSVSSEILTSGEVLNLCDRLEELLSGKLKEDMHICFMEPDLEFNLSVAKRLYDIPGKVTYRDGYMDVDIEGDWIINFWCDDGLGYNSFKMGLSRVDLEDICNYLKYVVGRCCRDDSSILAMLKEGRLLPE